MTSNKLKYLFFNYLQEALLNINNKKSHEFVMKYVCNFQIKFHQQIKYFAFNNKFTTLEIYKL